MGPYKPLRTWVDDHHPLLYGNIGSLDPGNRKKSSLQVLPDSFTSLAAASVASIGGSDA